MRETAFGPTCQYEGGERMETKSNAKLKALFIIVDHWYHPVYDPGEKC